MLHRLRRTRNKGNIFVLGFFHSSCGLLQLLSAVHSFAVYVVKVCSCIDSHVQVVLVLENSIYLLNLLNC